MAAWQAEALTRHAHPSVGFNMQHNFPDCHHTSVIEDPQDLILVHLIDNDDRQWCHGG